MVSVALARALLALLSLVCGVAAFGLAASHAVASIGVMVLVLAAAGGTAWHPHSWLWFLPALWPVLNFSPWTGWWLLDESDILLLAVLAGGYARWALAGASFSSRKGWPGGLGWIALAVFLSTAWAFWRGWADAGAPHPPDDWPEALEWFRQGMYAGYDTAWNSVRVLKSVLWALLLLPLLMRSMAVDQRGTGERFAHGMVVGLSLLCVVVLWERHTYTGLLNFSLPYRTSAWFWEMHVGGGAIDAYLAMAAPFAVWALWQAPSVWRWVAANGLLWATVYAVLTTFSRGIYLALLISFAFMAVTAWRLQIWPKALAPKRALFAMALALGAQSALVLTGGVFMAERLSQSNADLLGRLAHWQAGWSLLHSTNDRLLGLGLGRLPAHYSAQVPAGEFAGGVAWQRDSLGESHLRLSGPKSLEELAPYFGLTQRVRLGPGGSHRLRLEVSKGPAPQALVAGVCVRHLLFAWPCEWAEFSVEPGEAAEHVWLHADLDLSLIAQMAQHGGADAVLEVSAMKAAQVTALHAVELIDDLGQQRLDNIGFAQHLAHWMPSATGHFQPWHMDNLYLELLIERGALGALVAGLMVAWALQNLWCGLRRRDPLAWALAGSLLAMFALGVVISILELPRVALILLLLLAVTASVRGQINDRPGCN